MMHKMLHAEAVSHIDDDGQRIVGVKVTFDHAIFEIPAISVSGRHVTSVELGEDDESLLIHLDPKDPGAVTRHMTGGHPWGKAVYDEPRILVTLEDTGESILTSGFEDADVDQFQEGIFHVPDSDRQLHYQLFIPKDYDPSMTYPLVLFIHDAGVVSDDPRTALLQGTGAVSWMREEEQNRHPCFVLAPQYPNVIVNDAFGVSWEADATIDLIRQLCELYTIDPLRIYGTGQSMGTMTLCELMLRHPKFFAACYLVAGQWDAARMGAAKDENLWILVSEQDPKAWPIMGACVDAMEAAGAKVVRGGWSAREPLEDQEAHVRQLQADDCHIYFTHYTGDSVKPEGTPASPGACHVYTWQHAFRLHAIKDWIFQQTNGEGGGSGKICRG